MDSVHNQCDEEDWRGHCRRPGGLIWASKENADVFGWAEESFQSQIWRVIPSLSRASLVAHVVKNLPAMQETGV